MFTNNFSFVRSCLSDSLTKCYNSFCFQYIVWVQSVKPDRLHTLAKSLDSAIRQLTKCDLQLELVELEFAAKMVDEEQKSPQQKSAKSSRDVAATQDSDDSDSEDSSSDSDSSNSSTTSSDDEESAESLSDVIKPKKQLCHVIKAKNVTTDSDDTSDEETSPKRKVESQIVNLEKDFNAIGIESEEQSLLINSISSSETDATHKQNLLIIENNPPPNGHAATEVKCKVGEPEAVTVKQPETVKVQQLEAEVKETDCVTVKQLEAEVQKTDVETVKQLEAEVQKTDVETVKQLEAEVQKTDCETVKQLKAEVKKADDVNVKAEETDAIKVEQVEAEKLAQSLKKVTIE